MVLTKLFLSTLVSISNFASAAPSLCDIVMFSVDGSPITDSVGQHLARYCAWTGPDAPVLDSDVCCNIGDAGAECVLPNRNGRCRSGKLFSCEYGTTTSGGGVICHQPFPSACDAGLCVDAPEFVPGEQPYMILCCGSNGVCHPISITEAKNCEGAFLACDWGIQNTDGTVECFD